MATLKLGTQSVNDIKKGTTNIPSAYLGGYRFSFSSGDTHDYANDYLTFVAETDNVTFAYSTATSSNKLKYSLDNGSTWNELSNGQSTTSINSGDKISFKASGLTVNQERGIGKIIPSASARVQGNIMSLAYEDNFSGQTVIPNNFQFRRLFSGDTTITSAENMVLPATTIKKQCYSQMFHSCTSLVKAPNVIGSSAMTWDGDYCFSDMFNTCASLTTAPELPATNLSTACYWYMFQNCTSLTTAPILPATTLVSYCYNGMFYGCSSLNYIEAMFTTTPSSSYMQNWVNGVASSGTFVKNRAATWSTSCGTSTYPCNWTVQYPPTEVEYLTVSSGASSGGLQLLTNVTSDYYYEVDSQLISRQSSPAIVHQKSSVEAVRYQMGLCYYSSLFLDYGGGRLSTNVNETKQKERHTYGVGHISGSSHTNVIGIKIDGTVTASTNATTTVENLPYLVGNLRYTGHSASDFVLFDSNGIEIRIYSVKIYKDYGDTLVGDYVPMIDSNGNATLYDKVSGNYATPYGFVNPPSV